MARYYYAKYAIDTVEVKTFSHVGEKVFTFGSYGDFSEINLSESISRKEPVYTGTSFSWNHHSYASMVEKNVAMSGYFGTITKASSDHNVVNLKITFTLDAYGTDLTTKQVRGAYIGSVAAENGTYPINGIRGSYWYVRGDLVNQSPTISGTDEDLGDKKGPFSQSFSVDDGDAGQELNIVVKLNGSQMQSISNATRKQLYTVDIDQATFDSLTLNAVNTIEISVTDGNGATAIRRWTFTRSNSNPTVSVDITNAGEQNLPFSVTFTPDDQDGDEITCKIFLDDIQVADLGSVTRGEKKTYSLGKMDFSKLRNGAHKIKIGVTDTNGGKGYGFVDFTKNLTSAYYKFTKETEGQALFVTVQLMAEIAEGAKVTVKVCNNALDTKPTWEEVPSEKVGEEYKFNNSTKTADNWAVGIWVQIDRGSATKDSYWYGAVGSYR